MYIRIIQHCVSFWVYAASNLRDFTLVFYVGRLRSSILDLWRTKCLWARQQQALYYSLPALISGLQFSSGSSRYPESEAEQKRSDVIMITGVTTRGKRYVLRRNERGSWSWIQVFSYIIPEYCTAEVRIWIKNLECVDWMRQLGFRLQTKTKFGYRNQFLFPSRLPPMEI
jgi:hypothetical protein